MNARATTKRKRTSKIDLFVAYLQALLGGDIPVFLMMDRRYFELLVDGHLWREKQNPVAQLRKALYGITRAGYDFTGDFQAWLVVNLFVPSLNEPGILNLWHAEDNATMIKRAENLKEYLKGQQEQTGKNLREIVNAQNTTTVVKHGDWGLLLDEYDRDVESDDLGPAGRDMSTCLLYTSPSPRDATLSRMPSSA